MKRSYPKTLTLPSLWACDTDGGEPPVVQKLPIKVPYPTGMTPTQLAAFREGARRAGREMRRILTEP